MTYFKDMPASLSHLLLSKRTKGEEKGKKIEKDSAKTDVVPSSSYNKTNPWD